MSDGVNVNGYNFSTDEVSDPDLGGVARQAQYVKLYGGDPNSSVKISAKAGGVPPTTSDGAMVALLRPDQPAIPVTDAVEGTVLDPAWAGSGGATVVAALKGIYGLLATITGDTSTANVAFDTSVVKNGATSLTPKFAVINATASGDNQVVAAVSGKKIRVLAYNFIAAGTVTATWKSDNGGTAISGPKALVANSGLVAPYNPNGWFETVAGKLLNLSLGAAIVVGGELLYVEI